MANNAAIVDRDGARRLGRASYIVSGSGIIVTAVIIGITVGVIFGSTSAVATDISSISSSCAFYYVNGICYTYRTTAFTYCFGYSSYDGYCYYNY
jgi:hypothetical protein